MNKAEIITFCSYVGGVGRTMAVANVAALLAQRGYKVLTIDLDLETPGLDKYFLPLGPDVDLKTEDSIYHVPLRNPNRRPPTTVSVDFLEAGTVPPIDIDIHYDYILVDSTAGFEGSRHACTSTASDKIVLVFTPNERALTGALEIGRCEVQRYKEVGGRQPALFPLLSRVPETEEELKREAVGIARGRFEALFCEVYGLTECDLTSYFNLVRIPHRGYYGYKERIASEWQAITETGSLAHHFYQFARCLDGAKIW